MLAILYNEQICCLSQEQNVIRNPTAKFDKEVSGKPMAIKSWKRKHWLTCEAELLRFAPRNEVTLSGIAPLRYLKRNYCASLLKTELFLFAT